MGSGIDECEHKTFRSRALGKLSGFFLVYFSLIVFLYFWLIVCVQNATVARSGFRFRR
jgi:hypothetical protein